MKFLNDAVRKEFHLLSIEKQKALCDTDQRFSQKGLEVNILHIEGNDISLSIEHIFKCPATDDRSEESRDE